MTNEFKKGNKKTVTLLIEDTLADQVMTRRAFEEHKILTSLHIVSDGEEALHYLERKGAYQSPDKSPRPDLILLDLNLPKIDGRDLLKIIKSSPQLKNIPVVVLTTSEEEADICETYDLGVNSYIIKPVNFFQVHKCIQSLSNYWFELVTLPPTKE